eukprot:IDg21953t1
MFKAVEQRFMALCFFAFVCITDIGTVHIRRGCAEHLAHERLSCLKLTLIEALGGVLFQSFCSCRVDELTDLCYDAGRHPQTCSSRPDRRCAIGSTATEVQIRADCRRGKMWT